MSFIFKGWIISKKKFVPSRYSKKKQTGISKVSHWHSLMFVNWQIFGKQECPCYWMRGYCNKAYRVFPNPGDYKLPFNYDRFLAIMAKYEI